MSSSSSSVSAALAAAGAEGALEKRAYGKVFWRLVPFLMLCYVVAYLDRVNVGFAKLQMAQDLGFSETVFGLGAGAPPAGDLVMRHDRPTRVEVAELLDIAGLWHTRLTS